MKFISTEIAGLYIIEVEPIADDRGFFARSFCQDEFHKNGLASRFVQCNISYNLRKGTVRGMHLQLAPKGEEKLVRCTQGSIHDIVIDLRRDSKTFGHHFEIQLTSKNRKMLYIPQGMAHGFQTLEPETEVFYQMSEFFDANCASGIRYNDPICKFKFPLEITKISEKDLSYVDFA